MLCINGKYGNMGMNDAFSLVEENCAGRRGATGQKKSNSFRVYYVNISFRCFVAAAATCARVRASEGTSAFAAIATMADRSKRTIYVGKVAEIFRKKNSSRSYPLPPRPDGLPRRMGRWKAEAGAEHSPAG